MRMRYIDGNVSSNSVAAFQGGRGQAPAYPFAEMPEPEEGGAKIEWSAFLRSVLKRKWYILAAAVIATALAGLYAQSIKPVFRSTTTLLIESGKAKILSIEDVYNGASQDREYYQTQVEILRSREIAKRTVIATRLWDEPEFDPRRPVRTWSTRLRELVSPPPPELAWTDERLADETIGRYLAAVSIEPVRLSQLVKINFEANDRLLAAKMADATALNFIQSDADSRVKLSVNVTTMLQDRLGQLREKLLQSEQDLQKYREGAGLVVIPGSPGVAGQEMSEINQRLVSARVRRTELESAYQQAARVDNGDYSSIGAVIAQGGLQDARSRVMAATMQIEELSRNAGEANPKMIEARNTLAAAQRQLQAQSRSVVASLRNEMNAARETERSLTAALESARTNVQGVNRKEYQLGVLEREVSTNKQLYELFLSRTKETSVSTNLQGTVARIVDSAVPSGIPVRPNKPQLVMMALIGTLVAGSLLSIFRDRFANTMQDSDEAENKLHVPVLATLPAIRASEAEGLTRGFLDNPRSQHAHAIRNARTSMLLSKFAVAHKTILVTSALSGEGKTTFCSNLALAHAQTKRTLLIDCDLRNPQIGVRLGLPADAKGISDLVAGTADLKDCVHAITGSSLLVMPAGSLPGSSAEELLLSPPFREALKSLANRVDIVLIDSPPVAGCSDALIIAQQANDTIFVVKARDTPHLLAQRGLERLQRAGASILGLVLTNVDESDRRHAGNAYEYNAREDARVIAA